MTTPSIIYLGADHQGFALKESIKRHLVSAGIEVEDCGANNLEPHDDYPVYAARVAQAVQANPRSVGILLCGSAEGMCIAANKFDDIRAGIGYSIDAAQSLRADDHGNVLCIPGKNGAVKEPLKVVDAFLATEPSNAPRHIRRVQAIDAIEDENSGV